MNKIIISAVIIVGVLALIFFIGPEEPKKEADNTSLGILSAEESYFDFGEVSMAKGDVSHVFSIKNTGTEQITLGRMYTSCMCTTAFLRMNDKEFGPYGMIGHGFIPKIGQVINPGEEGIVEVIFDPAAHGPAGIGRIERVVTLENNSGQSLELGFSAVVTP